MLEGLALPKIWKQGPSPKTRLTAISLGLVMMIMMMMLIGQ